MQSIDIEALCRWAYGEELIKRATSSAEDVWTRIADIAATGAAYDTGSGSGPQRYDIGSPDPDAIIVEAAVSRLPDVALDWEREAPAILGDLLALVEPRVRKNAPVTSPSAASWTNARGTRVSVVLPAPRQVILVRTLRPAALVTAHAHTGTRPKWQEGSPKPQWVPSVRGHGPTIVGECRGKNYYTTGSYCPLAWEPSVIAIAELRADYLAWWRALALLREQLNGQLKRWSVFGPTAPEMPWRK